MAVRSDDNLVGLIVGEEEVKNKRKKLNLKIQIDDSNNNDDDMNVERLDDNVEYQNNQFDAIKEENEEEYQKDEDLDRTKKLNNSSTGESSPMEKEEEDKTEQTMFYVEPKYCT